MTHDQAAAHRRRMDHQVQVRLPDGRLASAGLDDPIVPVLRRIMKTRLDLERDYQLVQEWPESAEREGTQDG